MAYIFEHDDPYKILAQKLIGYSEPCDIVRMMHDNSYILNRIVKETRNQDICGYFTDCIIEDILEQKARMEYMKKLDQLAEYFYSRLNKERLREEIKASLKDAGIDISEIERHSTAGNVSSDNT